MTFAATLTGGRSQSGVGANDGWCRAWTSTMACNNRLFQSARTWRYAQFPALTSAFVPQGIGGMPSYDSNGYHTEDIPIVRGPNTYAPFVAPLEAMPYAPAGTYKLRWDGSGNVRVRLDGNAPVASTSGAIDVVVATAGTHTIQVMILSSSAANRVRNMRLYMPGQDTDPSFWHPAYKQALKGRSVFRAMTLEQTNGTSSPFTATPSDTAAYQWARRVQPGYYTQVAEESGGIALEHVIELANEIGIDPYTNYSHLNGDPTLSDWIPNEMALEQATLNKNRVSRKELSNEIWNTSAGNQHSYYRQLGADLGLNLVGYNPGPMTDPGAAFATAIKCYARNVALMSAAIRDAIGNRATARPRVKIVLGSMAAAGYGATYPTFTGDVTRRLLESLENPAINPRYGATYGTLARHFVDEVAIAPYYGRSVLAQLNTNSATDINTLMPMLISDAYNDTFQYTRNNVYWANLYGLPVVCYEAGANFFGQPTAVNARFPDMRHDSRMETAQAEMFRGYWAGGGAPPIVTLGFWDAGGQNGWGGEMESGLVDAYATYPTWRANVKEIRRRLAGGR